MSRIPATGSHNAKIAQFEKAKKLDSSGFAKNNLKQIQIWIPHLPEVSKTKNQEVKNQFS